MGDGEAKIVERKVILFIIILNHHTEIRIMGNSRNEEGGQEIVVAILAILITIGTILVAVGGCYFNIIHP